jgi:hypothetical protein
MRLQNSAGGSSAMEPTISCRPTTIRRLPPSELALFTVSVATLSATTPSTHSTTPVTSAPPPNLSAMMIATPAKPAISPRSPPPAGDPETGPSSPPPPAAAWIEAMIAASEASTVCIATKFSPR